jgi:hypothetical protein
MNIVDYKPWEEHPELWKTEAEWWSYLRGSLRRGLWEKSPIKLSFKNANCEEPPEGYTGRAKSGAICPLSGQWTGKSKLEVDHCNGNVSLLSWDDVLPFIMHLVPPKGTLQLVDKEMHKVKSYAEKQGVSFEEALIEKRIIAIIKNKQDKQWLIDNGVVPGGNQAARRKQIKQRMEEMASENI